MCLEIHENIAQNGYTQTRPPILSIEVTFSCDQMLSLLYYLHRNVSQILVFGTIHSS